MRYIENNSVNPRYNLALEEYVAKELEIDKKIIILWQNEPSVIVGRFQNTLEEINTDYIKDNNINVVRRITGGGAVYHDLGNLNFSFIEKTESRALDFYKYNERIIVALSKLGINAQHNSRNDIAIEGKKFSGNAQHIFRDRILHHGTILFNSNLNNVQKALNVGPEKFSSKATKSVKSRITNVINYMENPVSIEIFKNVLLATLFNNMPRIEYRLTKTQIKDIEKLKTEKYDTWEWNYGSSPKFNVSKTQRFKWGKIDIKIEIKEGIIENVKIFGDFFTNENIEELEQGLRYKRYERDDILKVIETKKIGRYFPGLTNEEFLGILL
jgi:lipoate-protein ligase A